ncbi:peptide-methionine (S)-S-oxide reductase MsrA [Psychrobacter pygoscelis]|uniref:peptide-methionine (S)-S-oxide reductase MsrA n=1 Tax=Psychrobacter pygoscelis TaxID=2488563 RepID=UPI001038FE8C|nr:peptide-methionine (S)-S-oxide reductase MsrA [Psychrobacter pygoscelis]
MQTIILGGGCFWCTESVFLSVKGVQQVTSGYTGGDAATANYNAVCGGDTGHIEVIKVDFDESVTPLEVILDIFFATHDPTTRDRQGNDVGSQYRSVIFYTGEQQKPTIDRTINKLRDMGLDIVTEVHPASEFFEAEDYHQDYFNKNPDQGYCQFAIPPKLAKLRKEFNEYVAN